jgi:hypothetical protein
MEKKVGQAEKARRVSATSACIGSLTSRKRDQVVRVMSPGNAVAPLRP